MNKMKNNDKFTVSLLTDEFTAEEMGRISGIEAKNRDITINCSVFEDCVNTLKHCSAKSAEDLADNDLINIFKSKIKKS